MTDQAPPPTTIPDPTAGDRLRRGVASLSQWTLRLLILCAGLWVLSWIVGRFWTVLLPILLGLMLSTVLWPPVRWLRKKLPPVLAAILGVLALPVLLGLLLWWMAGIVAGEWSGLAEQFGDGIEQVQAWLAGPPLHLDAGILTSMVDQAADFLQSNSGSITSTALAGIGTIGSIVVTLALTLLLAFFMVKDGPRFLPWLRTWTGDTVSNHVSVLAGRVWDALGRYVWSQAAVAFIDAVFIGLGAWLLGVPFALPIALLTFIGGFIPIIGAFVAGLVAVLVALVAQGPWIALAMLGVVVLVQQVEGNVVQPILMSRSMKLHAAVVLMAVTAGSALFGIIGALLAVPAVSVFIVVAQYIREQTAGVPADEVIGEKSD